MRTEAKRRSSVRDHEPMTAGVECRRDADLIRETPAPYKPIEDVMAAQADLDRDRPHTSPGRLREGITHAAGNKFSSDAAGASRTVSGPALCDEVMLASRTDRPGSGVSLGKYRPRRHRGAEKSEEHVTAKATSRLAFVAAAFYLWLSLRLCVSVANS